MLNFALHFMPDENQPLYTAVSHARNKSANGKCRLAAARHYAVKIFTLML